MPLLTLLTGPLGKIAGIAALALGLLAAGALALHQHDARVRAEQALAEQKVRAAALAADHAKAIAALEADAEAARQAAARATATKVLIHAAPPSTGCVDRPAIRAALDGLRRAAGGDAGTAAASTAQPAGVPAAAGAPAIGR